MLIRKLIYFLRLHMAGAFLYIKKYLSNPLITGTIFLTLAGTTSRFMGFFFRIFLNDIMGTTGLGLYQLVLPLMSICLSLCCNGFQTATSKLVAEKTENRHSILISALLMSSAISILLTFIMYTNANFISLHILGEYRCIPLVQMLSFSILPASVHSCINGYYYGLRKTVVPAVTQLLEQTARIGTCYMIYIVLSGDNKVFSPVHSICGLVAGEIAATLFSVATLHKDFCEFSISYQRLKEASKKMALFFIPLSLNYILISVSSSIENLLLPKTLRIYGLSSSEALDIFGTLTGLALPVLLFPGVLCSCACVLLLPSISEANAAGKCSRVSSTISKSVIFGLCFGLTFTAIFYFMSDFIGGFLFSSKMCGYFLRRLCWLCPMMHISGMLCSILHGLGKAKHVLLINILTCSIRISMIVLFVPKAGIDAYLWSMLVSHVFMTISVLILLRNAGDVNRK